MTTPITWSGQTSAYEHKHNWKPGTPLSDSVPAGLRKVWYLDAQWSTCPVEVEDEVRILWRWCELGNDNYILKTTLADLEHMVNEENVADQWVEGTDGKVGSWVSKPLSTAAIQQWIREQAPDIGQEEKIIIHWWW